MARGSSQEGCYYGSGWQLSMTAVGAHPSDAYMVTGGGPASGHPQDPQW